MYSGRPNTKLSEMFRGSRDREIELALLKEPKVDMEYPTITTTMIAASLGDQKENKERRSLDTGLRRSSAIRRKYRRSAVKDNFTAGTTSSDSSLTNTLGRAALDNGATVSRSVAKNVAARATNHRYPALLKDAYDAGSAASSSYGGLNGEEADLPIIGTCHVAHISKPRQIRISAPPPTPVRDPVSVSCYTEEAISGPSEWEHLYDAISKAEAQDVVQKSSENAAQMWSPEGIYIPQGILSGRMAKFVETGLEQQSKTSSCDTEKTCLVSETPAERTKSIRGRFRDLWRRKTVILTGELTISSTTRLRNMRMAGLGCLPAGMWVPENGT